MERMQVSDVAQVYELWKEVAAFVNDGDLKHWISLWIEDGIQIAPDAPLRIGQEQIQMAIQPTFDSFIMSNMVINTEEVRILGDRAYSYGSYVFDMAPKDGEGTTRYSGKFLDILEKQADGSWKIAVDCHNYNEPHAKALCS